jgi:hypothetical protein
LDLKSFPARPEELSEEASRLLGCPGYEARTLAESVSRYEAHRRRSPPVL